MDRSNSKPRCLTLLSSAASKRGSIALFDKSTVMVRWSNWKKPNAQFDHRLLRIELNADSPTPVRPPSRIDQYRRRRTLVGRLGEASIMNGEETLKLIAGSIGVYVIMAACSATSNSPGLAPDGGLAQGDGSSGGGSGSGSGGDGASILDALTDPVPDAKAGGPQSGTRLKATYYAGADGSQQPVGLHDSQLNVDCGFARAADGTMRCLPSGGGALILPNYYVDQGCTQPLVIQYKGCAAPAYVTQADTNASCALQATTHVLAVGAPFTGPSVWTQSGSSCSGPTAASSLTTSHDLYTVGAEVPATSFVQGTLQTEP